MALSGFSALIFVLSWGGIALTRGGGLIAALWLANAVLTATLLQVGWRKAWHWIAAAFLGFFASDLLTGSSAANGAFFSALNTAEAVGAYWLLLRWQKRRPDMTNVADLARFTLCCGVIAPTLSGLILAIWIPAPGGGLNLQSWFSWSIADGLGMLIGGPIVLIAIDAWQKRQVIDRRQLREIALILAGNVAAAILVFGQSRFPLLFLAFPMVIVAAFRLGVFGTAAAIVSVSLVATIATLLGSGPMSLISGALGTRIHILQLFLATAFAIGLPIASALAGRDRIRAELKRSRDFSDTLVNTMQEAVFRTDASGCWIFLNPAWETLTGYTVAESLGWPTDALLHPEDRARATKHYPEVIAGNVAEATIRQRFYNKAGVCRTIEVTLRRLTDADGAFDGSIGTIRDISDERAAQAELAESKRLFEALADLSPAGIFRTDCRGDVTYVNQAWMNFSGLTYAESMGSGWGGAVHPDDLSRISEQWADTVMGSGELRSEFRFCHTDGSEHWVEVITASEQDAAGARTGFIGVNIDITERKRAEAALAEREEQLTLLAENATDAVFRLTLDGTCLYASPSVGDLIGVAPQHLVGRNMLRRLHPDDNDQVLAAHQRLARGETERLITAYRSEPLDRPGSWIWLEANSGLVRDPETQEPREIICSIRDITVRKQLEFELDAARHNAEIAAQAKSSFLANMSHEIRTPMNGVLGFTELLMAEDPRADQRPKLQMIADSGTAMMRLLNDILDLSKIEAGHVTLAQDRVDVRQLAESCAALVLPMTTRAGLDLRTNIAPDVPDAVIGDGLRLRQIILNLLGNAAKFTAQGSIVLGVAMTRGDLVISVGDTGIGIAPNRQAAIFGEFVQADAATTRAYGGTGLGLSISNELAKLMGGALSLFSAVGVGTTVTLRVPLVVAPAREAIGVVPEATTDLAAVPGARVLVAEDHEVNQLLIKAMLTRLGYVPEIASNGVEAVARVRASFVNGAPFGLVLMDMQMPELDGISATQQLRADGVTPAALPIVALTANAYASDVEACLAAGMQGHLAKPVQMDALDQIVRRWAIAPHGETPVPAPLLPSTADPELIAQFDARVQRMFALLDSVLTDARPAPVAITAFRDALHQLAGTAAFFGQAELGDLASDLDDQLSQHDETTDPAFLHTARASLRRAAAGGK